MAKGRSKNPLEEGTKLQKAWSQLPNATPQKAPKSYFYNPQTFPNSQGFVERKFALNYDLLRYIVKRVAILTAIINTRCAQVAAFCEPYRLTRSLGFIVRHKDPDHSTTPAELQFIKELEEFISRCGRAETNPYSKVIRDDFEIYLRKIVRDTLTLDAVATEIIHDRNGLPFEFYAIDASTIRYVGDNFNPTMVKDHYNTNAYQYRYGAEVFDANTNFSTGMSPLSNYSDYRYVQMVNGQMLKSYSDKELAYGVRNPKTDYNSYGYGESEIEQILDTISHLLNTEAFFKNIFLNNSIPKGMLNIKGSDVTQETIEELKRFFTENVRGVENSLRTPVIQSDAGVEWVDLQKQSNMDMGLVEWQNYLIKIVCGTYLIDPNEISFAMPNASVQQQPLFEGNNEWKLKASKDKGLKPLLKFIAKYISRNIIDQIDDHFTFEFVGLEELTQAESQKLLIEQLATYRTMNEIRREKDLPELGPAGDVPMNPAFIQYKQTLDQMRLQQQQMEQQMMVQQQAMQAQPEEGQTEAVPTQEDEDQYYDYGDEGEEQYYDEESYY